ncbi:hypothetical protein DENSPDRAFT_838861 [Dentipellis sp. KUC8613]|nr:hypothetical protein DENSPDRAFT_838861 [Dentipellis sp. KUC8613]
MWPKEVRNDLRAGVKAKHQNDFGISERFLRRAYDTAQTLPLETFAPHPHLKLSGIAVLLGEVQEANNKPEGAYDTYAAALAQLQANWAQLVPEERLRGVALAHKLGAMADEYQLGTEEEERWLTFAVTEVLRVAKHVDKAKAKSAAPGKDAEAEAKTEKVVLAELALPKWVTTADIGAPIESLGAYYAKTGKLEFAMPLYLQAISLLVPKVDSGKSAPPENLCRGAYLMNNLSELIMRGAPTPEKLHQAEAWARNALALIEKTKSSNPKKQNDELQVCEEALAVTLFNLASIQEMRNEPIAARDLYMKSWEQSKAIGMREGVLEAIQAMRRLERKERVGSTPGSPSGTTSLAPADKDKKAT